ncbi:hypothetical protein [Agaribacterium sp. ZY112]
MAKPQVKYKLVERLAQIKPSMPANDEQHLPTLNANDNTSHMHYK